MCKTKTKEQMNNFNLDDIIGQDEAVREIKDLLAIKSDQFIADYWRVGIPRGILFVGPPGTGKTMAIRALVNESDDFILTEIKYSDIASERLHEAMTRMKDFFNQIENAAKDSHVIVFIDEIDSFLPKRDSEYLHHAFVNIANTFMQWIDGGLNSLDNITIIGATNNYHKLDSAAVRPGRFDKVITFKELSSENIVQALKMHLDKRNFSHEQLLEIDWSRIESEIKSTNLSGAVVANLINNISKNKMREHYNNANSYTSISKSVPKEIWMVFDNVRPSAISTQDIINEIKTVSSIPKESSI